MGEYITIIFGASSAAPKAVEFDNALIVGDSSVSMLESTLLALTSDSWASTLEDAGYSSSDQMYKSVAIYFAASPTPENVYALGYLAGSTGCQSDVPLLKVGEIEWETPTKPPTAWCGTGTKFVRFYGSDGQQSAVVNNIDGSIGLPFIEHTDALGNWNGQLTFPTGLSGTEGIVPEVNLTTAAKITVDYIIGAQGGIGQIIDEYNINLVSLALENTALFAQHSDNVFGSQIDDLLMMTNIISGKHCMMIYALPGNADPDTTIAGAANTWRELRSLIGQREDFVAFKAKPSALNHDMAGGLEGMIIGTHPHTTMTFAHPHMGIQEQEPILNRIKFKDGQIATVYKATELTGNPYSITRGFTFGADVNSNRINAVRCKYIILQSLKNDLTALLHERTVLMSYAGMQAIKNRIKATFKLLGDKRIVDGLEYVRIPGEQDLLLNTDAGKLMRQRMEVPAIEIGYYWNTSLEEIRITALVNEAI